MRIIKDKIETTELKEMAKKMYGNLVKAMVDIEKEIVALDAPMHSDLMEFLISEEKSDPKNLWGINLYPEEQQQKFIEFDSVMNIRPNGGNRSRGVESEEIKNKIITIIKKRVA